MRKVKSVTPFDAKEIAIDSALVPIIPADNLRASIAAPHAQRGLAAISAVSTDRTHVIHLPRARLVTICARRQRTDRANIDTHATLFAIKMVVLIGRTDIR